MKRDRKPRRVVHTVVVITYEKSDAWITYEKCNSHGCGPELGVQSWEDDSTLDRGVENSAPAPLGYEGAELHRGVTGRPQHSKGKAAELQMESP